MELPVFGGFEPSIMRLIQTGVLQTQHVEHSAFNMELPFSEGIRTFDHETNSDKQTRHAEHSPSNMELPSLEELSVVEKASAVEKTCTALDKAFRNPLTNSLKLLV